MGGTTRRGKVRRWWKTVGRGFEDFDYYKASFFGKKCQNVSQFLWAGRVYMAPLFETIYFKHVLYSLIDF